MAVTAKVKHDKGLEAYVVQFDFDKWDYNKVMAMAAVIKQFVPVNGREYDSVTKQWTILEQFWGPIETLLKNGSFKIVEEKFVDPEDFFYNQGTNSSPVVSREALIEQLVILLDITPEELADASKARKAYLRAARKVHPDYTRDKGEKMSELNSAWQAYNAN